MMLEMQKRLYHPPLHRSNPKRVLDIGTGKGAWAIDFGSFATTEICVLLSYDYYD